MTIASEIQRIKSNIENAYTSCETKGVTLPDIHNSENLADTINNISGGGSSSYIGVPRYVENGVCKLSDTFDSSMFKSIKDVSTRALAYAFYGYDGLNGELDLSSITTVSGYGGMNYAFYGCGINSVNLSNLTTISGTQGLTSAFANCEEMQSVDLSSLKSISGMYGMYYCFQYCQGLSTVTFDKLSSIASRGLSYTFSECYLSEIYFPELTVNSFADNYVFSYMLSGGYGTTVHFPYAIEEKIGKWSDVLSGFGGSGITVLFDLKRATVEFTTSSTADIYLRGTKLDGTTGYAPPGAAEYIAYSSELNTLLLDTASDLVADTTTNIYVDLNQPSNKITIDIGISGLEVIFTLRGCTFTAVEETSGCYSINFMGPTGTILNYDVNGGDNYTDANGTITTNGDSITETISLNTATISTFTRPTITSNGTFGGDSFAVSSTNTVYNYNTYAVADSTTTNYVWLVNNSGSTSDLCFYNPLPLKVSALGLTTTSTTYSPSKIEVYGSNDNSLWTLISTHSVSRSTSYSITPNSTKFYKYHKLTLTSTSLRIKELTITATQKG